MYLLLPNKPHGRVSTFCSVNGSENNAAIKYISHYKKHGRNDYGRTGLWTNRYMDELVYGRIVSKALKMYFNKYRLWIAHHFVCLNKCTELSILWHF